MKILMATIVFVSIWAACFGVGLYGPSVIEGGVPSSSDGILYGGFGLMMGPVLAFIIVSRWFERRPI